MEYYLYKYSYNLSTKEEIAYEEKLEGYNISTSKLKLFRLFLDDEKKSLKTALLRLYFWVITRANVFVYYVSYDKQIVHISYVLSKCYKFPFMKSCDYEIGPCYTSPSQRGKGIYPAIISRIKNDLVKNGSAYMIVRADNYASIRGIEKSGFSRIGSVVKKGKKYIRVN